jgi:hypothetical protein
LSNEHKASPLYPRHHPWELEPHYSRHVSAMTTEQLHYKSATPHGACYPKEDPATGRRPTKSADYLAHLWCHFNRIAEETHPAEWYPNGTYDKAAGPKRNQRMVDKGACVCLAFPTEKSVGTWDCIKRANRAGIPVRIIPEKSRR